jgi:radical SAM-linked protein
VFALNRIRLKYSKGQEVKFISHLDLLRTFHRAIKRAGIPVVYSQGFNPHLAVSFGPPLPVGTTSDAEYIEIELLQDLLPEKLKEDLNESLPKGIRILDAKIVTEKNDKFLGSFLFASYNVKIEFKSNIEKDFMDKINCFLSRENIFVEKQGKKGIKTVDILPDILHMEIMDFDGQKAQMIMKLSCGSVRNLKPETVIEAMKQYIEGIEIEYYQVHRTDMSIDSI